MQYRIGQIVEGTITGIQPYGAFVSLDEETSGLIHISEISEGFVKDVNHFVHVHDRVKVKIIDFDKDAEIIIVSSVGTQSQLRSAIEAGAKDFIQKPLNPEQLHSILTSRFEGR